MNDPVSAVTYKELIDALPSKEKPNERIVQGVFKSLYVKKQAAKQYAQKIVQDGAVMSGIRSKGLFTWSAYGYTPKNIEDIGYYEA